MVRRRSSRRAGCTYFMAECMAGANRNTMPTSSRQAARTAVGRLILTPSASMTSAEPHFELILRLPCLATRTPAPATTNAVAVEILKVPRGVAAGAAGVDQRVAFRAADVQGGVFVKGQRLAAARMASAKPTISSTVSPFMCRATSKAAICASVALPEKISVMTARASSRVSDSRWLAMRCRASVIMGRLQE